ncbi:glycoside hydrolase family 43 protein [Streptomyces phaeoluteigriseus]|uniref:Glycoside hydrolase family 43 protein n=1 Tax=Streptomyces phaeoluteigriseus TaxID=114686 RepID=A0ABY4ZBC4_9ACTN|nr:glycoside hydrolase family 43 protein [Streptomyces phaeoluteigriseus]USQ86192.1 glycoside hydrolase family 43 protein [Streptomyces phaeoluteigriseus]
MTTVTSSGESRPSARTTAQSALLRNPVLAGFEPDPCAVRVGDDYYLVTSTFEWYPGVRIHHSRDLLHWRCLGGALDSKRLLDLRGVPDSGGIWAPGLSYVDGLFHLVFTVVDTFGEGWKDVTNHLTTAPNAEGPWSDPVLLHSRGFDTSLFHDEDGSSWMLNMRFDWRPEHTSFAGVQLQPFDRVLRRPTGEPRMIFTGTAVGVTEGPHLYRKDGWYYLVTAEGGTGYDHQTTVARSRSVAGPYETDPAGPMITARHDPSLALQKAGHCSLVETQDGTWYAAHIVARPYSERGRCVLGRETALQPVRWSEDGWPRIEGGIPAVEVPAPALPPAPVPGVAETDRFDGPRLGPDWSTLRRPAGPDWVRLSPGRLRISGGQSPGTRHAPSLVARRVTDPYCSLETEVTFEPFSLGHMAGLTAYYNTRNWHYLHLAVDDDGTRLVRLLSCEAGRTVLHPYRHPLPSDEAVGLRAEFAGPALRFSCRSGDGRFEDVPVDIDATTVSDEAADEFVDGQMRTLGFTGAMLGLWVHDLDSDGVHADFSHATYRTGRS